MNKKIKFVIVLLIITFVGQMLFSQNAGKVADAAANPEEAIKKLLDAIPAGISENFAALPTGAKIAIFSLTMFGAINTDPTSIANVIKGGVEAAKQVAANPKAAMNPQIMLAGGRLTSLTSYLTIMGANAQYYKNADLFMKAMKAKLIEYKPEDVVGKTDLPKSMKDVLDESDGKINVNYCASLILNKSFNFSDEEVMKALEILVKYNKQTEESETLFSESVTPILDDPSDYDKCKAFYSFGAENSGIAASGIGPNLKPTKGSNRFVSESIMSYALKNSDDTVKYVIDNGGWNSVHNFMYLINAGKYDLAKLILDKKDPNKPAFNIDNVYRSLYNSYFSRDIINPTYELAIIPDKPTPKGFPLINMTPLQYAIGLVKLDAIKFLVENGASTKAGTVEVEVKTGSGNKVVVKMKKIKTTSPLALAKKNKNNEIIEYLVSKGAK